MFISLRDSNSAGCECQCNERIMKWLITGKLIEEVFLKSDSMELDL